MRIVVFSDSHGNAAVLPKVIERHPEAEAYIFLGDGEREFIDLFERHPHKLMRGVRGNCDWNSRLPLVDILTVNRKRIFITHGHSFYVKRGLSDLLDEAKKNKANILLYGHTHMASADYRGGIYLLSPGSVAQPRDSGPSYGYVDITEAGVFTGVVRL